VQKKLNNLKYVGSYQDGFCAGIRILAFVETKQFHLDSNCINFKNKFVVTE
jgi:hypothetical protein